MKPIISMIRAYGSKASLIKCNKFTKARELLEDRGHPPPGNLLQFPAVWSEFFYIEQVTNKKKISGILTKQNLNRTISRLLRKNCPTD